MTQVISATVRRVERVSPGQVKRQNFLTQAVLLLNESRHLAGQSQYDLALEKAYQSALRVAGAEMAASPVIARRKRLPTSAWDRLALVGPAQKVWAEKFQAFSRTRSRILSGIQRDISPEVVFDLMGLAAQFLAEVEAEGVEVQAA